MLKTSDADPRPPSKRHEQIKAWQACHDLTVAVYRTTGGWPESERYVLIDLARRAAFGAAVNIAEGSAKRGHKEFRRFLDNSLGSLAQLSYLLFLARELGILTPEAWGEIEALRDHASRLTWGLHAALGRKEQQTSRVG